MRCADHQAGTGFDVYACHGHLRRQGPRLNAHGRTCAWLLAMASRGRGRVVLHIPPFFMFLVLTHRFCGILSANGNKPCNKYLILTGQRQTDGTLVIGMTTLTIRPRAMIYRNSSSCFVTCVPSLTKVFSTRLLAMPESWSSRETRCSSSTTSRRGLCPRPARFST